VVGSAIVATYVPILAGVVAGELINSPQRLTFSEEDMDLIAGVVVVTSVFLIATAIVARPLLTSALGNGGDAADIDLRVQRRARSALVPLLVGFFIGLADVFVTAQQPAVAFINLIVGAATVAIVYDTARTRRAADSREGWEDSGVASREIGKSD
jgi:hypothetical protein